MSSASTLPRSSASMPRERASHGERSYYGRPVIKEPVWHPEIPWYFFMGGMGGASAGLAYVSGLSGNEVLARRAWTVALAGVGSSPVLLISDLGVPRRFLNMLRMFKVTSPMSVGSWVLAASGATTALSAANAVTGMFPLSSRAARPLAALLGLPLSTYTGALIAQTAVPAWHQARIELPALFAAGAAASAGAAATAVTPVRFARPARRLAVLGSAAELAAVAVMEQRLDERAEPYHTEAAGAYGRLARGLTAAGALLLGARAARSRPAAVVGGGMILAGAVCERWSVFKAGFQSARDPKYTVGPQRQRIAGERTRGASRGALAGQAPPARATGPVPAEPAQPAGRRPAAPTVQQAREWIGRDVQDPYGEHIGKILDVMQDRQTGAPEWLVVSNGSEKEGALVPIGGAAPTGKQIRVVALCEKARSAPAVRVGGELEMEGKRRAAAHYAA